MVVASSIGGCGGFARQWSATTAVAQPAADLTGAWQGVWSSEVTGHSDGLRCIITHVAQDIYSAHFHAKFMNILSAQYTTILRVSQVNGGWRFTGESDLGWFGGGVYQQKGEVRDNRYDARYESKYDRGVLRMSRPDPNTQSEK